MPDNKIPDKMNAVVMSRVGLENVRLAELNVPRPNENQILARVDACTICTSTFKLLAQGPEHPYLNGWDIERYPVILGDEGAITAVEVGANLRDSYYAGERLAIQPAVEHKPVNHRQRYRNPDLMKKVAVGYTLGGHLAQYILVTEEVIEANCLVKLPSQEMGHFEVSLSEPLSCVVSSQDHHIHFTVEPEAGRVPVKGLLKGGVTVIFGAGVMGRFHIEAAISHQPGDIVVFDIEPDRFPWIEKYLVERAGRRGVKIHCERADRANLQETLRSLTGRSFADDIIDATGSVRAQEAALKLAGRGSVFNSFGGLRPDENMIKIDMRRVHYDEMIITGSSGGGWADTRRALELVNEGNIHLGAYIRLVGGLPDAVDFLKLVKSGRVDGKAIVYPDIKLDKPIRVEDEWTKEKESELLISGSSDQVGR